MSTGYVPLDDVSTAGVATDKGPGAPQTIAEVGLGAEFVTDLLIKTIYSVGPRTGQQLTDGVKLPFPIIDELMQDLQQRQLVEVRSTEGASRAGYTFDLSDRGRARAREAMASNQYVGPAPVPLTQYRTLVGSQGSRHAQVTRRSVESGFGWLVLNQETLDEIGPAINSGRSLFLHGESGNGKTAISETIAYLLGGNIFVPYAVEIDGQVMVVYDPLYHRPPDDAGSSVGPGEEGLWRQSADTDQRWVCVRRPVVLVGGELTLDQLDLQYDTQTKLYQAPFQVKANGGVLILDDFGRQRVPPRELLNRWIVPLEKRVDFLTLHTGSKFPIPFDALLVIATNIDPKNLVEEAFLRRIHYKIRVESPSVEQYEKIFERYCAEKGVAYDTAAVRQIFQNFYHAHSIAPRGCHPRDLVDHLLDIAKYLEIEPTLASDLVDRAGRSYFLDFPTSL